MRATDSPTLKSPEAHATPPTDLPDPPRCCKCMGYTGLHTIEFTCGTEVVWGRLNGLLCCPAVVLVVRLTAVLAVGESCSLSLRGDTGLLDVGRGIGGRMSCIFSGRAVWWTSTSRGAAVELVVADSRTAGGGLCGIPSRLVTWPPSIEWFGGGSWVVASGSGGSGGTVFGTRAADSGEGSAGPVESLSGLMSRESSVAWFAGVSRLTVSGSKGCGIAVLRSGGVPAQFSVSTGASMTRMPSSSLWSAVGDSAASFTGPPFLFPST